MELYFSPLACSMASRIALYEAGGEAEFRRVDTRAGQVAGGGAYEHINPKGLVPALRTDDGQVLTENSAVLQYIADRHPESGLAPAGGWARSQLQSWLSFISTELHKAVFSLLLSPKAPDDAKAYARELAEARFDHLDRSLQGREHLMDRFTVADAYLAVVLNWAQFVKLDLSRWPAVAAYRDRLAQRPSVARAMREELALFQAA